MRKFLHLLAAAVVLIAAPAANAASRHDPDAELQKTLAGYVAGKPIDCIPLSSVTGNTIVAGRAIIYRVGSRLYVNETRDGARRLNRDDILVTRSFGSNLCRLDVVNLLDRTSRIPHGFVSLGQFVPYTKPRRG